jgi:excisionase family DNA binding protein
VFRPFINFVTVGNEEFLNQFRRAKTGGRQQPKTPTEQKTMPAQMTTTKINDSEILTMDQAARILSLSRRTIQNKIKAGEIRAYRASQRIVRLRMSDINDYLDRFATLPAKP